MSQETVCGSHENDLRQTVLIEAGNMLVLVDGGLNQSMAARIANQYTAKCAEVERLRTALKPFADYAAHIAEHHPGWDHDQFTFQGALATKLVMRDFRAARAAYGQGREE